MHNIIKHESLLISGVVTKNVYLFFGISKSFSDPYSVVNMEYDFQTLDTITCVFSQNRFSL